MSRDDAATRHASLETFGAWSSHIVKLAVCRCRRISHTRRRC